MSWLGFLALMYNVSCFNQQSSNNVHAGIFIASYPRDISKLACPWYYANIGLIIQ
uniref:Uncharacterized protein n=1 Tax=Anguilla anguilla TaxID=7936 RepID=A0A0E9SZV9_ANGAN